MKTRSSRPNPLLRLLFYVSILFLVSWIVLWGENSFFKTWNMKRKVEALEKEMNELKATNERLELENQRLKSDPKAAEKVAREKFGLTKEGEKVFRFIPGDARTDRKAQTE